MQCHYPQSLVYGANRETIGLKLYTFSAVTKSRPTKRVVRQDLKLSGPWTSPSLIMWIPVWRRFDWEQDKITNCLPTCRGRKCYRYGKLTRFQFGGQIFIDMYSLPSDRFCGAFKNSHGGSWLYNNHSGVEIPRLVHQITINLGGRFFAVVEESQSAKPLTTDRHCLSHTKPFAPGSLLFIMEILQVQAVQRILSVLSSPPGVPAHDVNMPCTCGRWLCFVLNDIKIPFRRLHKLL